MELTREQAIQFIARKLASLGVSKDDAEKTAEVLVEAELREDPSHGISCLLSILKSIKNKEIISGKKPEIIVENNATAIINGENILGPVSGISAVNLAMKKAKEHGISAVSIRKSHHLFTLGYYTKIIALNNLIGILTTSTAPAIFAPGGLEKVLGTNPFSISIPSKENPLVIDMSSTHVARGKLREAVKNEKNIPLTWALDEMGNPTNNPEEGLKGSLQPLGGYKGFALALAIDILSGILSESASGKEIFGTSMHVDNKDKKTAYKGDLVIVIDISKFTEINLFKSRVSNLIKDIENSRKIDGIEKIHIPGERAHKNKDKLINIDEKLHKEIIDFN
ncbi:MAG: Ldh family oxidoreductase [Nanoarchaeota archaeon]